MQVNIKQLEKTWDTIIIGSGIGGLTLAAYLTKIHKKKVLLIEQHDKVGGFSHEFSRRGSFKFDVGVHYVGSMYEDSYLKKTLDYLCSEKVQWEELSLDLDHLYFPDLHFSLPSQSQALRSRLKFEFPHESENIDSYLDDVTEYCRAYFLWQFLETFPWLPQKIERRSLIKKHKHFFSTTQQYFSEHFQDKKLISILTAQWGGYGLPPQKSSFAFHCVHVFHFLRGAFYPKGGGQTLAKKLSDTITENGSVLLTKTLAKRILFEGRIANGVSVLAPNNKVYNFHAPVIVSNTGLKNTYHNLLQINSRDLNENQTKGNSAVIIYLGLKDSAKKYGFTNSNYWLFSEPHHEISTIKPISIKNLYLSFPSLKRNDSSPTAEIIIPINPGEFDQWKDSSWKKRNDNYEQFKKKFLSHALELIQSYFPQFCEMILFSEVATPLTVKHFQNEPNGAIYGLPATVERLQNSLATSKTPVENVFMVGSDSFSSGIIGALMSAMKTFEVISAYKKPTKKWVTYIQTKKLLNSEHLSF